MANEPGSLYFPANADEIRDDFLTDVRLEAIAAGVTDPAVHPFTDWHILGTACANISLIQYANINTAQARTSVLNATGSDLEEIREAYGDAAVLTEREEHNGGHHARYRFVDRSEAQMALPL